MCCDIMFYQAYERVKALRDGSQSFFICRMLFMLGK